MLTTSIHKDFIGMMADALTGKMNGTNTSNFPAIAVTASFTCCPILFNQLEFCFKTTLPCSVSLSVSHDPLVLRMRPPVHQAGLLHAISPISMKLGQFKVSTPKLQKTNGFLFWIFLGGDRRPPLVLLYFYQGKCYNIRQK